MMTTFLIFLQFLYRDFYVYRTRLWQYAINYVFMYPACFSFAYAYVEPNALFGPHSEYLGTLLFTGSILIVLLLVSYKIAIQLLFDLENTRFIDYQMSILPPRLILLEQVVFASLFTFLLTAPFFPIGKLLVGDAFLTINTSWPKLFFILYLSALCASAYHVCASCFLEGSEKISLLWGRSNTILMSFGGIFIPMATIRSFSTWIGYATYANPFAYITEGIRSAILGGPTFTPYWLCATMLMVFSVLFTCGAWHYFKKKTDHI